MGKRWLKPWAEVRDHAKSVGLKESEVDRLEWDLTKQLFTSELDFCRKLHLKKCLDVIVEVSDRAEDSANQLELVTLKSMYQGSRRSRAEAWAKATILLTGTIEQCWYHKSSATWLTP